jgi:hypothetical protein
MAEAVAYNNAKFFVNIFNVRPFIPSEGSSEVLSKISEQAKNGAIDIRHSASKEKQQQTERQLLVFLAELDDESDYNDEFLKPSKSATNATRNILLQAYRGLSNFSLLPKFVTADGVGGIRIQWQNEAKELRLLCSNEGALKLYWQDGDKYGLEEPAVANIILRFGWLKEV